MANNESIAKLKRARGIIKGQLTRAHNWIKAFDAQEQQIEGVEVRLSTIERAWVEFGKNQDTLEEADPNAVDDGEREAFESEYYAASATAKALIAARQRGDESQITGGRNSGHTNNSADQIKLPPINLPTFNGSYDQWPNFRDTFKAVIDENQNLSDIKKLYYLRLALKGLAAEIIASITMSADNYEIAWKLLEGRFENKRVLVHHHLQALIEFPAIQKESHAVLRQLLDTMEKHVRALKKLNQPTEHWSTILVFLLTAKLDSTTKRAWENKTSSKDVASYEQFVEFITNRCIMLETLQLDQQKGAKITASNANSKINNVGKRAVAAASTSEAHTKCPVCAEGDHKLYQCPAFLNLTPQVRIKKIQRIKVCSNCLQKGHKLETCSYGSCRICSKKHNTLLHCNKQSDIVKASGEGHPGDSSDDSLQSGGTQPTTIAHCAVRTSERGLLATAIIKIQDAAGESHECRAFLDPGSQTNFITRDLCNRMQLPQYKNYLPIRGIHGTQTIAFTETQATILSRFDTLKVKLKFSVLPEIITQLPLSKINIHKLKIPETLTLADPFFHVPGRIDVLLGSSIFWNLLGVGQVKLGKNQPVAQKTKLGWIIAGPMGSEEYNKPSVISSAILSSTDTIENQLERFWHIEEGAPFTEPSENDKICEEEFVQTHRRNSEGRFEVRLPFRGNIEQLGSSREIAIKRLKAIERKFDKSTSLKEQYNEFMCEYQSLGHMTKVAEGEEGTAINYLPHHAVIKEDSETTKLRVVFDASSPTSAGIALNDIIRAGPTIQQDLFDILLRFRQHQYVITADIQKMYRQILLQEDQRDLQRIVWRQEKDEPIQEFRLNTLTYGLASAPYLATRCLLQLAIENQEQYPEACRMLRNDFYIDDLLSGGDCVSTLKKIKIDLTDILRSAGFTLHKWNSNESSIVNNDFKLPTLPTGNEIKTLGICWNTTNDSLQYKIRAMKKMERPTKRSILSTITQIYDPLGLMGPTIICAKIILQQLWKLKLSWDESLPLDLHTTWIRYQEKMESMSLISIPRHVICPETQQIEMHGFCDASESAYGVCIYIRSTDKSGQIHTQLLCAKSRVAPLKQFTLPRLELCGALLLAKLGQRVKQALSINIDAIHYWTDSTIALAWIKHSPEELQTFVANRVADIQRIAPEVHWAHVRSQDNPADIISKGTTPEVLKTLRLWWKGPEWLAMEEIDWPREFTSPPDSVPELKKQAIVFQCVQSNVEWLTRFSSLTKLTRVTAYCLRFKINTLTKESRRYGALSVEELKEATTTLILMVQADEFALERANLQANKSINKRSKLITLNPFLDKRGIIRIGGRLRHANIEYSRRHPIVLPAKHPFTELVIRDTHLRQLHVGPQGILAHVRQSYWILSGRQAVRRIFRKCIVCFRARPTSIEQIMGDLPKDRVKPSRAFLHSGVDYAGPFNIKISRNKSGKAYLCIFVCFSTKAIHLEIVSDLSTTAFLNSLKRFIARRGRCAKLFSDNGLNFIGADNELKALVNMIKAENEKIEKFLADQAIQWTFIPPYSPHMGGLWEAAVKAAKTHLTKIANNRSLTFEELCTIFAQIEAILNSRPLYPISDNPQDCEALTPGHFIIGEPLNSFPEPDLAEVPTNRLTRFQLLSQMRQHFWKRWSNEYLTQLQNRYKWRESNNEIIKVGALVLLKDKDLPPLKWRLARIIEIFPGDDKHVRVVSVKTSTGITKRAINKICVLPMDE